MNYDFTSRERDFGRAVFALTLDKKRMTERIVIGRTGDARMRNALQCKALESNNSNDVYYDAVRPLGSLLISFEADKKGEWNTHGMTLRESYEKIFPRETQRWKMAAPAGRFLKKKFESGEPSAVFAAVRTWDEYLNCYGMDYAGDTLTQRLSMLYKPFMIYGDYKPWQDVATAVLSSALRDGESEVELWYPVAKRTLETVVIHSSFLPVIFYYLNRINEWRFVFQGCKVCGRHFLARSRHYEICSDECRKEQAIAAKRDFDERAKNDRTEQLDEAAYFYWYNRLRKLRKEKAAEKTAAFKAALDIFRNEAVRKKGEVKRGEMQLSEFSSWLIKKQDEADRLMDKLSHDK